MKKILLVILCLLLAFTLCACDPDAEGPSYHTNVQQKEDDNARTILSVLNFDNKVVDNSNILVNVTAEITNNGTEDVDAIAFTGPVARGEITTFTVTDSNGNTLESSIQAVGNNEVSIDAPLAETVVPGGTVTVYCEYLIEGAVEDLGDGKFKAHSAQLSPDIPKASAVIMVSTFEVPSGYYYHEAFPSQAKYADGIVTYRTTTHSSQFNLNYGLEEASFKSTTLIYIAFPVAALIIGGILFLLRKMK